MQGKTAAGKKSGNTSGSFSAVFLPLPAESGIFQILPVVLPPPVGYNGSREDNGVYSLHSFRTESRQERMQI